MCEKLTKGQRETLTRHDVAVMERTGRGLVVRESCGRCGGTGIYTWPTRRGPASGECFKCGGNPHTYIDADTYARRLRAGELREEKRRQAAETRHAEIARREAEEAPAKAEAARVAAEKKAARLASLNWIDGDEGDRVEMDLQVIGRGDDLFIWSGETDYGTSYLYKFKTRQGDLAVLFTSASPFYSADPVEHSNGDYSHEATEPGGWVRCKFTIKAFEDREGEKQTKIQRVKFIALAE